MAPKIEKTDAEWREELGDELTFRVTRQAATERPFSHPGFAPGAGVFHCVCCGQKLFTKDTKYDSGCGWPSFTAPADAKAVDEHEDLSHGMRRVEVTCSNCGAHLGHVFPDGPRDAGGLRYCINGVALEFEPEAEGKAAAE
ncbi:peptide-methionine (R)-S-oxide reductase MsrB [Frigidibacter oleivorans]|uniref:peptide-methionine (R)-S-oxide reductase MsrB n=1 Tax=Frigidibacter oleivorans TaxID=2487129 RepID=UPI000F8C7A4B|nr:peptide-methionine (R)-S-oxide reductase MsrB [Frigidibacter oleivorans]